MSDSSQVDNHVLNAGQDRQNIPPESKMNWSKDFIIPIALALVGFVLGFTGDIVKNEYELRSNTPRIRRLVITKQESGNSTKYRQAISMTVYPVGRPAIKTLVISAIVTNSTGRIINEQLSSEPLGQEAEMRQLDQGNPEVVRSLRIDDFHEPQHVTWDLEAESPILPTTSLIRFHYSGVNDIQDANKLPWMERISLLMVALTLIIYSFIVSALALYFRMKGR